MITEWPIFCHDERRTSAQRVKQERGGCRLPRGLIQQLEIIRSQHLSFLPTFFGSISFLGKLPAWQQLQDCVPTLPRPAGRAVLSPSSQPSPGPGTASLWFWWAHVPTSNPVSGARSEPHTACSCGRSQHLLNQMRGAEGR